MLTFNLNILATDTNELEMTLEEVLRQFKDGHECRADAREDGINKYDYSTDGDESEYIECDKCGYCNYYEGDKPTKCWDCGKDLV